jgi:hypothetical protein
MAYSNQDLVDCGKAVEAARERVAEARQAYSKGGSVNAVNEANRALADAHCAYRECSGGNVPDRRR